MYQSIARTSAASDLNFGADLLHEAEEESTPEKVRAFHARAVELVIQEKNVGETGAKVCNFSLALIIVAVTPLLWHIDAV
jgi:hypothetical protein